MPLSESSDKARQRIGAAAIELIDGFAASDLLAAITPERLGTATGYSASTVRYQLRQVSEGAAAGGERRSWSFDREALLTVMAEEVFVQLRATTERSVGVYLAALEQLARAGNAQAFGEAIRRDMDAFSPGGDDDGTGGIAERARLLTVIACECSPELAQRVRAEHHRWIGMYAPVYDAVLRLSQRRMLPGLAQADLAQHVSGYLHGLSERRRFDPRLDHAQVARSVVAILFAFTEPLPGSAGEGNMLEEMMRRLLGTPPRD